MLCNVTSKLENLLLDHNGKINIADFKLVIVSFASSPEGTLEYMAPKVILQKKHGTPVCLPFQSKTERTKDLIIMGRFYLPASLSCEGTYILACLLKMDPIQHFQACQVLKEVWVRWRSTWARCDTITNMSS
ncbi:hypothetical protein OH76DRAFT_1423698 [Lentinus brumalis]|uniref:Protein kinase domain-containing protein n=1 Tax=Lentinus brumalis TaxID=2498619 RepID=A0A371CJH1_9APHY|nr:hypothetical protein OH76DRAFT_1423698 [Polyporus brumalis]